MFDVDSEWVCGGFRIVGFVGWYIWAKYHSKWASYQTNSLV